MAKNLVIIEGTLANDPAPRFTQSGSCITTLRLKCQDKKKDGSLRDFYVKATVFGGNAEAIAGALKEGDEVHLEGQIDVDSYEPKDGGKRVYETYIKAFAAYKAITADQGGF